ncbi:MAG: SET domain-containing protein [Candidatus Promineifilaceae bacterium]|nr:SET domain-containing protein [Anaerolineaceae bacterium]
MIHPATELRYISPSIGFGVFATTNIPQGTIVYVQDALEIVLPADHPLLTADIYQPILDKYSTVEKDGSRLLSWDIARYVNHSCHSNALSTGYGFEIAVRDILPGEEITDDYGQFNLPYDMPCACGHPNCRGSVRPSDFTALVHQWDANLNAALANLISREQPLWRFLDEATQTAVTQDLATGQFRSVQTLHNPAPQLT